MQLLLVLLGRAVFEPVYLRLSHHWNILSEVLFFFICRCDFFNFQIHFLELYDVELLDLLQLLLELRCLVAEVMSFDLEVSHGLSLI